VFASLNNFELSEASNPHPDSGNMRIILYSLMSIALEFFRKMMKMQASIDPLFLHTRTHLLKVGQQLLYVDMFYLLVRIVHHVPITEATFVILQYFSIKTAIFTPSMTTTSPLRRPNQPISSTLEASPTIGSSPLSCLSCAK
jgi:hypothetical protein